MPKISIIVPVYKAEKYLHRCLDSILQQTFPDWECILVDDGSPDGSGAICDEYAARDSRFWVIHKENGGVSSARQMGLDAAQGGYVIHADPDDWVDADMLAELYAKALADDADMVICDYYSESYRGQKYIKQEPKSLDHESVLCEMFDTLHGSTWNKLVRRSCFVDYDVRFPTDIILCEDLYVNAELLQHPIKVAYLPKAFYHYDLSVNQNSIVRRPSKKTVTSLELFTKHFMPMWQQKGVTEALRRYQFWTISSAYHSRAYSAKEIRALIPEANNAYFKNACSKWYSDPQLLEICATMYGIRPIGTLYRLVINAMHRIIKTK